MFWGGIGALGSLAVAWFSETGMYIDDGDWEGGALGLDHGV